MAGPINSRSNSTSAARSTRGAPIVIPAQITGSSIQPAIDTTMPAGPCTLKKLARRSLLYATHQDLAAEIWMIPVVDFQLLPDMGRMNGQWPWAESRGCSPAPIAAAERAAAMYALIVTAKLNDVDPQAWLADVLARIAAHPSHRLDELLPWNWTPASANSARAA